MKYSNNLFKVNIYSKKIRLIEEKIIIFSNILEDKKPKILIINNFYNFVFGYYR